MPISKVGIILVFFRQGNNIEPLYRSLALQKFKDFTVYFVDNNSDPGDSNLSKEMNKITGLNIKYLIPGRNTGFAEGNNLGAKEALKDGCEYVFFLNNDMLLDTSCIVKLVKAAQENSDYGVFAPLIFLGSDDCVVQEFGAKADFQTYRISKYFEGDKFNDVSGSINDFLDVDLVSGGATFVKAEALKKAGLWEESYFAYGDEIGLALRTRNAGYKTAAVSSAKVYHLHNWDKANKAGYYFEYYLIQRNKYLYFKKHGYTGSLIKSLLVDWIKYPWRFFWFIKVCDIRLAIYYLKGTFDGLMGKSGKPGFVN